MDGKPEEIRELALEVSELFNGKDSAVVMSALTLLVGGTISQKPKELQALSKNAFINGLNMLVNKNG